MDVLFSDLSPLDFVLATAVGLLAGLVKGMVGFGMPMILISGLSMLLPPDRALAGLILPTLATNGWQALRQGWPAALLTMRRFRVFLIVGLITLLACAQLVGRIPAATLLLLIAAPIVGFATLQLMGYRLRLSRSSSGAEAVAGALSGSVGGISGVWGPPVVAYLTAIDTPKHDQMRIQGVLYGLGAVALMVAHLGSGVLRAQTIPLSAWLIIPAITGMWLGGMWQDRIDQAMFRRLTLIVLLIAGLNLMRRAIMG